MTKQSTTVKDRAVSGKHTNPSNLQWPADRHGFTAMLRKEGVRAVGRMAANDDNYEVFMKTLRVLADHAGVKLEHQKDMREAAVIRSAKISASDALRIEDDRQREIKRLKAVIASSEADLAGKLAHPSEAEDTQSDDAKDEDTADKEPVT
jgi:hypothetical protein